MQKATLKFSSRDQAQDFATNWAFYSKRGHLMGPGKENVTVCVFDVTEDDAQWIDSYAARINNGQVS